MKYKKRNNDLGFTLVELMTVMAIIGILATAIMVSLSAHRKRAAEAKALSELSAVMQNIYLCIADEGIISSPIPNGGAPICNNVGGVPGSYSSYGNWPRLAGDLQGYTYLVSNFTNQPWMYSARNAVDNITICCNSVSSRCRSIDDDACDAGTDVQLQ